MRHGNLTRAQAEARCGTEIIARVSWANVEPTGRTQTDGDSDAEFTASLGYIDNGFRRTVTAYYYQPAALIAVVDDLDELTWVLEGYEIE